jgi:VWFA-related protein
MKLSLAVAACLLLSLITPGSAQQAQGTSSKNIEYQKNAASSQKQGEVVKIGVTLVQIDVTVTDSKGRPVTDLKAEDFEVLQDSRPQQVTNCSYVVAQPEETTPSKPKNAPAEPPAPPPKLKPDQVRRAIALVADDLTLSFNSAVRVRDALKKFVDEQVQPGDLVAVIRTGAGMGALQQFTNDKRQLYAAIDRVRWKPGYGEINTFAPVTTDPARVTLADGKRESPGSSDSAKPYASKATDLTNTFGVRGAALDSAETFRQEVFAIGTLGALGYLVRGLKDLPGRKSVVLFSDALRISNREQNVVRVQQALNNLTDLANRASVSFYTIDARGLEVLGLTAADDLAGDFEKADQTGKLNTDYVQFLKKTESGLADRSREFFESQEGLAYLADRTGGFFTKNSNDLSRGVRRALQDQAGYYLIGFVPDESTFKSKNGTREFHNIEVRVKRPGLRVRTRTGFYGLADEESRPLRGNTAREMLAALASPFTTGDIRVRMTSQFFQEPKGGAFVDALLHIDARDLTFEETVNGWRKVTFEVAAFTFGDNGKVVDQSDRSYSVSMSEKDYKHTLGTGIFYRINLPIKKPGAYQLRTAVRDRTSKKLGSANQFIEVPNVKLGKLALSGLIVRGSDSSSMKPAGNASDTQEGRVQERDPQASPAVRRFKRGMVLEYAYVIYRAKADKATGRPQLTTQLRLYRDGKLVYDGEPRPFDPQSQTDLKQLVAGGSLRLGSNLTPGDYALQVIAVDKLAKEKDQMATGWIDFEIVPPK